MKLNKQLATLRGGFLFGTYFLYKLLIEIHLILFQSFNIKKYKG